VADLRLDLEAGDRPAAGEDVLDLRVVVAGGGLAGLDVASAVVVVGVGAGAGRRGPDAQGEGGGEQGTCEGQGDLRVVDVVDGVVLDGVEVVRTPSSAPAVAWAAV